MLWCQKMFMNFQWTNMGTEEEKELYSEIENLIIVWNIDGTKTAGSLTRDIMKLIKANSRNEKLKNIGI